MYGVASQEKRMLQYTQSVLLAAVPLAELKFKNLGAGGGEDSG